MKPLDDTMLTQKQAEALIEIKNQINEKFNIENIILYGSIVRGVSAVLLERKMSFKKPSGVRAYFHREFIKEGLIEVKWGRYYDKLFEDRQEGDYTAFIDFGKGYVSEQLELCDEFLKELKNY